MPSIVTERVARGKAAARKIVADALRLNWRGIEVAFAVRCTAGVAIPLIASLLAGEPLAGASAAYGALVTGLASRQGVYRTRVVAALAAGLALALSAFAGALTGPFPLVNIAVLALWALAFGILASLGRAATVVSVNGCVAFVVFSNPPYDAVNPAFQAAMVFAGCALQLLLLVLVWPLQRYRAERAAVATAYTALAQYATGVRADDLGLPDTASLSALSAALADPQPFGSREELAAYQALADEAERLRETLAALATEQHLLAEVGLATAGAAVRAVCDAAGPLLDGVAAAVSAGRVPAVRGADWGALDAPVRALERIAADNAPCVDDARALAGQLRAAVRSGNAAATGGLALDETALPAARAELAPVGRMLDRLLATCSWSSIYVRHAIRLAVTLTIAAIVQHRVPLAHAQWIALTVVLVLRPDFSSTFTRGVGRVAGTVAGAILASAIAAFHPSEPAYVALAIGFAALGFALFNVGYALFSVAITGYVVFLLALGGAPEHASAIDRVAATALGGVLALVAYGAWPAWSRALVADDLANLIDAQRRYLAIVLRAFAEPSSDEVALRAAQVAAWRARASAEASVDQMAGEPVRPHAVSVRTANGILAASRRLGIAGLTLRGRIARISGAPHAIVERFSADLDTALRAIVAAQRSGTQPGPLPPLRNDQIALKHVLDEGRDPVVEVLVSETDLIVDSVNTMAAVLERAR
jgi:uncharacterized membrane protein YccC